MDEVRAVEEALYDELSALKESCSREFELTRQQKLSAEQGTLERRDALKDEFESELEGLRWSEAEKFNELKRKLEYDVHTIEQQLMLMKAGFQMNAEKLEYNFQVLKRRDEENTMTKSKQKRRITKLQDQLTKLRERLRKQEQKYEYV